MLTTQVALSEIDLKDKTYLLSDIVPDQKLIQSISDLGLLNPVKLIKTDNGYIVITGWKRINVLMQLGSESVYSQVYNNNVLLTEHICRLIYTDNKDRITELEKAELLRLICSSAASYEKNIIENVLPFLGLNPTLNNLKKYLAIAALETELKKACMNEDLTFEQLQLLSEIDDPDFRKEFYNHFIIKYKFNNNEMRDLLKDVQAICIRKNISTGQLAEILPGDNSGKSDKNKIRKTIKTICYPKLTETEQIYNELVKELNLGNTSRLVNHPYFESNELELRIKFKNQKDLKNEIEILKKSLEDGRIEKLLQLIKEGI